MARNYKQGKYEPVNKEKYVGNLDQIWYRSSYELQTFQFLDGNPNILRWSSEELYIEYFDTTTNKVRKYYPDLWVEYKTKDGEIKREIIEIKPKTQLKAPNRRHKHYESEARTYQTNLCKWKAAQAWCEHQSGNNNEITFKLLTEAEIFK